MVRRRSFISDGSPPCLWRIRWHRIPNRSYQRFTPTCVGNTMYRFPIDVFNTVHPHLCGEYYHSPLFQSLYLGSPPPVWGIRFLRHDGQCDDRFTPPCVGNTEVADTIKTQLNGSPPPVWGILTLYHYLRRQ